MKILSLLVVCLTLSACDTEIKQNPNFAQSSKDLADAISSLNNTITDYVAVDTDKKCDK